MQKVLCWSLERAVLALGVELVGFESEGKLPEGTHGWSKFCRRRGRGLLAISPDTHYPPQLVAFHELGHIVLEHGKQPNAIQVAAYADMEIQAMRVALALGEEFLADTADEWRDEVLEYIDSYQDSRLAPETAWERELVSQAIATIRQAGLPASAAAA